MKPFIHERKKQLQTIRFSFLTTVILLLFTWVVFCLSGWVMGYDYWYNGAPGGSAPRATGLPVVHSLKELQTKLPETLTPQTFDQTFGLKNAQQMGKDGAGETILFLEGNTNFDPAAFNDFCKKFDLPAQRITFIGEKMKTKNTMELDETMMDTEWAHVVAPRAKLVVLGEAGKNLAELKSIINRIHPEAISDSYISPNYTLRNPLIGNTQVNLAQWAAERYPYFVSSGDGGQNVPPVAVVSNLVVVGGATMFDFTKNPRNISSYVPWSGEGYGKAIMEATTPTYQSRNDLWRQVPDVVWLAGYPEAVLRSKYGWTLAGGTSLATPLWASLWTLADAAHLAVQHTHLPINANAVLYQIQHTNPKVYIRPNLRNTQPIQWGLGLPVPKTFVNVAAHLPNQQAENITGVSIATVPAWILYIIISLSLTYVLLRWIGFLLSLIRSIPFIWLSPDSKPSIQITTLLVTTLVLVTFLGGAVGFLTSQLSSLGHLWVRNILFLTLGFFISISVSEGYRRLTR